jgi:hypothetical protein
MVSSGSPASDRSMTSRNRPATPLAALTRRREQAAAEAR